MSVDTDSNNTRVSSLLIDQHGEEKIKDKYEEIYRASDVWLYKKSHGVHSVIFSILKNELQGKHVLDVGCGAGRLAIMCAHLAAEVAGFDFSEAAIEIAKLNAACSGHQVDFFVSDITSFSETSTKTYDVITLVGVLEHVHDPVTTLKELHRLTSPGGTLIVSCPNFINARGFSYMTLLSLFGLPMSLADLRQVDYLAMEQWCAESGYALDHAVGAIYNFGWGSKAAADMIKRVPLAVRDAQLNVALDYGSYNAWQEKMTQPMGQLLTWLEENGVLKRIERAVDIQLQRHGEIDDALWEKMLQYMSEDIVSDPYYSDVVPFAYMGGECIYVLKKAR